MKRVRAIRLFVLVCALAGVAQTFTAEMIYSYDELLRQEVIFAAQMAEMRKKEAMLIINDARQKALQGIMSSADVITIIKEQNAFIADIENALKAKMSQVVEDVKAADRVQENYVRSFMSVAKNLGSGALAPFKSGYGYTQEQKETASKVIDGLVEQQEQLTKDYQKAIKAKLTPVEREILKERYEKISADLNDEIYQQELITGAVMSMQRKLFWAAVAAGAAVAGIYLLTPGAEINPIVVDKIEDALSEKLNGVEASPEKQEMPTGVPAQVELNRPSLAEVLTGGELLGESISSQSNQETNGVQDVSDVIAQDTKQLIQDAPVLEDSLEIAEPLTDELPIMGDENVIGDELEVPQEILDGVTGSMQLNKPSLAELLTAGESLGESLSSQSDQETNVLQDISDVIENDTEQLTQDVSALEDSLEDQTITESVTDELPINIDENAIDTQLEESQDTLDELKAVVESVIEEGTEVLQDNLPVNESNELQDSADGVVSVLENADVPGVELLQIKQEELPVDSANDTRQLDTDSMYNERTDYFQDLAKAERQYKQENNPELEKLVREKTLEWREISNALSSDNPEKQRELYQKSREDFESRMNVLDKKTTSQDDE